MMKILTDLSSHVTRETRSYIYYLTDENRNIMNFLEKSMGWYSPTDQAPDEPKNHLKFTAVYTKLELPFGSI